MPIGLWIPPAIPDRIGNLRVVFGHRPGGTDFILFFDDWCLPVNGRDLSNVTTYGFDGLNRLISSTAGGLVQDDSCTNGEGRLCSVADATGSTSYSYAPEGDIVGLGFSIAGTAYGLGYAHGGLGRMSAFGYPDGNRLNYTCANGRIYGATPTAMLLTK